MMKENRVLALIACGFAIASIICYSNSYDKDEQIQHLQKQVSDLQKENKSIKKDYLNALKDRDNYASIANTRQDLLEANTIEIQEYRDKERKAIERTRQEVENCPAEYVPTKGDSLPPRVNGNIFGIGVDDSYPTN